jgi:hypothetical protein
VLVQLLNLTRTPVTLVLPHADVCSEGQCLCAKQLVGTNMLDPTNGELTLQSRSVLMPSSLQLFGKGRPGDRSEPLPASVKLAPDVARALRSGAIKAVEIEEPAPAEPPEPPAQAEQPTTAPAPPVPPTEETASVPSEPDVGDVTEQPARRGRNKER